MTKINKFKPVSFWKPTKNKRNDFKIKSIFSPKFIQPVKLSMYPSRTKTEWKLIDTKPWKDSDKDKVLNIFDCKPLNKNKQGIYHLPATKKTHRARQRQSIPTIIRSGGKDQHIIDVLSRRGGVTYIKKREEKLADIQKADPEAGYTKESIIEMERGNSKRVLAKGRTPGMLILQQSTYKSVPKYKDKQGNWSRQKKVGQITIVNTKTGDTEAFEESSRFTKKEIDKERTAEGYEDMKDYHPITEEYNIKRMDERAKVLNENPERIIKEKRSALRVQARDKRLSPDDSTPYGYGKDEEETAEALQTVTDYEPESEAIDVVEEPTDDDK